jgi:hypothetical protein
MQKLFLVAIITFPLSSSGQSLGGGFGSLGDSLDGSLNNLGEYPKIVPDSTLYYQILEEQKLAELRRADSERREKERLANQSLSPKQTLKFVCNFSLPENASDLEILMEAMIIQESGGNHNAVSSSGASGILQYTRTTWQSDVSNYEAINGPLSEKERVYPGTPTSQRKVGLFKIKKLWQIYGNFADIACHWYTGMGTSRAENIGLYWKTQGRYPSPAQHVNIVVSNYNKLKKRKDLS